MKPSLMRNPPARAIASRSGTAHWCSKRISAAADAFLALDAETDQCAHRGTELDRLVLGEVAEMHHLDLSVGVLMHRKRIDDAHRVALAQALELLDDLAVEIRVAESQDYELNRTDCHVSPLVANRAPGARCRTTCA